MTYSLRLFISTLETINNNNNPVHELSDCNFVNTSTIRIVNENTYVYICILVVRTPRSCARKGNDLQSYSIDGMSLMFIQYTKETKLESRA